MNEHATISMPRNDPLADASLKALITAEVQRGKLDLPLFNRTALRLQQVKESGSVTIEELAQLILQDQALATRLLRVANSSFFGGLKTVETVSAAVVRLGTRRVASVALLASQAAAHRSQEPVIRGRLPGLWARAYVSAMGCRWLAENAPLAVDAETAFLAGLLHDVGELYLYKVIEKLLREEALPAGSLTPALLDEVVAGLHAQVGHDVMRGAGVPEKYAEVALAHDQPDFLPENTLVVLCRLLDQLCGRMGIGGPAQPDQDLAASPEARALGLDDARLTQLQQRLQEAVNEANEATEILA